MVEAWQARLRHARGGHFWTMGVNQQIGYSLAKAANRAGVTPNHLSVFNLLIGVATSGAVALLGARVPVVAALVGLAGWQLAYSLDCADGQLARANNTTTPSGAVLDLLCDFLVQVSVVAAAARFLPGFLTVDWRLAAVVVVAGLWFVGSFYSGIAGGHTERLSSGRLSRWLGELRDYGLHIAVLPVALVIGRDAVLGLLCGVVLLNALFLARFVLRALREQPRPREA